MHCEITDCYFNTFFCWNTNEKRNLGKYFFSTQTGIPVSQMVWICHWNLSWKGFCLVFILISSYIILECYFSMFDFSSRKTVYCFITLAVSSNSHHQRCIYRTQSNIKLSAKKWVKVFSCLLFTNKSSKQIFDRISNLPLTIIS